MSPSAVVRRMKPVSFTDVSIADGFWSPRIAVNRERTIPHEYEKCKETGRIDAFRLDMPVERVYAQPKVRQTAGLVALQRGPIVYCLESVDNPYPLHQILLPADAPLEAEFEPDLLGGVATIRGEALVEDEADWQDGLYRTASPRRRPIAIKAVPYFAWDNREPGEMRVWIREVDR